MRRFGSLKFAVKDILWGKGLVLKESVSPDLLGLQDALARQPAGGGGLQSNTRLASPVNVEAEFFVGRTQILLEGKIKGRWRALCSRCLASFEFDFETGFEETYPLGDEFIDLAEELRQDIILAIPERPLCSENCRGLCPRCGGNLNERECGCE